MKRKTVKKIILRIVLVSAALFIAIEFTMSALVMHKMLDKKVHYERTWQAEDFGLSAPDTLQLAARDGMGLVALQISPEKPKAVVICLTGIQNPSVTCYFGHARMFCDAGYASVLLEVRGHEPSDGNRICAGYEEPRDVEAVTEYLKSRPQFADIPVAVMGISMGAGVAINSIGTNDDIDALVSISAYSSLEDIFAEFMGGQAPAILTFCIKPFVQLTSLVRYGVNPWQMRPKSNIKKLGGRPALLMHTKGDTEVRYANFERIMNNAATDVQTMVRDVDEHFFTPDFLAPQSDTVYCNALMQFLGRLLE